MATRSGSSVSRTCMRAITGTPSAPFARRSRWTWEISLWRSRGELALAEARYDEAWSWASRSLEAAIRCRQRKHATRAVRLQGDILAAQGRLADAARLLTASIDQARVLGTARESWIGHATLGQVLTRLGQDREAEAQLIDRHEPRHPAPAPELPRRLAGRRRVPGTWPQGSSALAMWSLPSAHLRIIGSPLGSSSTRGPLAALSAAARSPPHPPRPW